MIYFVEDDDNIRELVIYTLQAVGFEALGFDNAKTFYEAMENQTPDLILLDIMLPDEDGIDILKKIKANPSTTQVPVIMVTAKGAEYDKVIGLDSGADDYVTKPFGMMELVSRIKAVLRRSSPGNPVYGNIITIGPLSLDADRHIVTVDGTEVSLTPKEFQLLRYLMENKNMVISRDKLLESIWGYDYEGETRTVDVHIRMLRQKLGQRGKMIETVRGFGYRIGDVK